MSAVNHPAIIAYYDSFLDNGCLYIVMELAQRGDLAQLLTAHKPQSVTRMDVMHEALLRCVRPLTDLSALSCVVPQSSERV